eukprot:2376483-Prymnesium_polylepis.1
MWHPPKLNRASIVKKAPKPALAKPPAPAVPPAAAAPKQPVPAAKPSEDDSAERVGFKVFNVNGDSVV